jgi:hypothetical protein
MNIINRSFAEGPYNHEELSKFIIISFEMHIATVLWIYERNQIKTILRGCVNSLAIRVRPVF